MAKKLHTHILAYHAWGFDRSFWDDLRACFRAADGYRFESADRGYFNGIEADNLQFEPSLKKVLFVHSFGLHWCSDEVLEKADHLVIFNGYLNFHPLNPEQYKRSRHNLREMHARFVKSPGSVIDHYYRNTFHPQKTGKRTPDNINHDLLLSDLIKIDNDSQPVHRVHSLKEITILHGSKDLVVHKQNARQMYQSLRYRSRYFEILNAGHALPVTHAEKCFEIAAPLISGS